METQLQSRWRTMLLQTWVHAFIVRDFLLSSDLFPDTSVELWYMCFKPSFVSMSFCMQLSISRQSNGAAVTKINSINNPHHPCSNSVSMSNIPYNRDTSVYLHLVPLSKPTYSTSWMSNRGNKMCMLVCCGLECTRLPPPTVLASSIWNALCWIPAHALPSLTSQGKPPILVFMAILFKCTRRYLSCMYSDLLPAMSL